MKDPPHECTKKELKSVYNKFKRNFFFAVGAADDVGSLMLRSERQRKVSVIGSEVGKKIAD